MQRSRILIIKPLVSAMLTVLLTAGCNGNNGNGASLTNLSSDWGVSPEQAASPLLPASPPPSAPTGTLPPISELRSVAESHGISGNPITGRELPGINDPIPQLGKKLFFTKGLGGDADTACASCHHPLLGGGDDLSLSVGVGAEDPDLLGPGRHLSPIIHHPDGHGTAPRNAGSTYNTGLWDRVMFWDGRVESLEALPGKNGASSKGITTPDAHYPEPDADAGPNLATAQARFPIVSRKEMLGFSYASDAINTQQIRERLQARIGNYGSGRGELPGNQWESEFRDAFGLADEPLKTLVTTERIVFALGEYERSQVFVASPWNAWVVGDDSAIDDSAKRGAMLFFLPPDQGGAGCASCHSGDRFTDEAFHVIAAPQIGPGKENGSTGSNDFGRYNVTNNPDDKFAFRTPSLLNVSETGPWTHAGAYTTLEAVIQHHLDPERAIEQYDYAQIDPTIDASTLPANAAEVLQQFRRLQAEGKSKLIPVALDDSQVHDLVAFLKTLTDPCVRSRECLAPWIPDETDADPDGLRLDAHDVTGQRL